MQVAWLLFQGLSWPFPSLYFISCSLLRAWLPHFKYGAYGAILRCPFVRFFQTSTCVFSPAALHKPLHSHLILFLQVPPSNSLLLKGLQKPQQQFGWWSTETSTFDNDKCRLSASVYFPHPLYFLLCLWSRSQPFFFSMSVQCLAQWGLNAWLEFAGGIIIQIIHDELSVQAAN